MKNRKKDDSYQAILSSVEFAAISTLSNQYKNVIDAEFTNKVLCRKITEAISREYPIRKTPDFKKIEIQQIEIVEEEYFENIPAKPYSKFVPSDEFSKTYPNYLTVVDDSFLKSLRNRLRETHIFESFYTSNKIETYKNTISRRVEGLFSNIARTAPNGESVKIAFGNNFAHFINIEIVCRLDLDPTKNIHVFLNALYEEFYKYLLLSDNRRSTRSWGYISIVDKEIFLNIQHTKDFAMPEFGISDYSQNFL
jgi:hypothetical protein